MSVKIYHNPRCSKSRQALALLEENNANAEVVEYLKTPLTKAQISELVKLLNLKPREMMRTKEGVYKSLNLKEADDEALIQAIAENPILLERPIVVTDKGAAICRPPELVNDLI